MESVEVTAKSLDEAKAIAAEKLGVDAKSVTAVVLEETKGLFGKGSVRISASVAETKPAKAAKSPRKKAAEPQEPKPQPEPVSVEAGESAPAPKSRGRKAQKAEVPAVAAVEMSAEEAAPDVVATEEDESRISMLVSELLDSAGLDARVEGTSRNGKYVNVTIDGRDVAHLVGKHGEVLNALQYLVNVAIAQQYKSGVRATIDGNDYRRKREESLTKLATTIANEVLKRREEAVLDALPAFERRIVHKALAAIEGVTTYSEGEEPNRRVVIAPEA